MQKNVAFIINSSGGKREKKRRQNTVLLFAIFSLFHSYEKLFLMSQKFEKNYFRGKSKKAPPAEASLQK